MLSWKKISVIIPCVGVSCDVTRLNPQTRRCHGGGRSVHLIFPAVSFAHHRIVTLAVVFVYTRVRVYFPRVVFSAEAEAVVVH